MDKKRRENEKGNYEALFLFNGTDKDIWGIYTPYVFCSHLTPATFKFILTFRTGCYAW